jgi:acetylornithine deacetylase
VSLALDHLSKLVRIPSVSQLSNRPIVEYAAAILRDMNWSTRELAYRDDAGVEKVNLIASPPGQSVTEREVDLAFICHTDTVPYAEEWEQALEPVRIGDSLHGCGACDVKGFLACLLAAAQANPPVDGNGTRFVLTSDEEIGCVGSKNLVAADWLRPKRIVIGEPTSLHPARAGKGYCLARVTIRGVEAHSAHPNHGISAIFSTAHVVSALERLSRGLESDQHPLFSPAFTTLNVGTIKGGTAKNIVPGHCEFLVEWRPIPGQSPDRVTTALLQILSGTQSQYPGLHTELEVLRNQPGFETAVDAKTLVLLQEASGRSPSAIAFGSEASVWSAVCEEIIVFGPGDMRTAHSRRECVPLAELETAVQTLQFLMGSPQ